MIKYVTHKNIDKAKWDACIEESNSPLIYGLSWYLDIICKNWDALVFDDYIAVMPLPWKSKFGLKYIYHPYFAQQLGVFSSNKNTPDLAFFIKKIPSKFIKYECSFNYSNIFDSRDENKRLNLILDLNNSYEYIYKQFNTNTKRNIKKNNEGYWLLTDEIRGEELIQLKTENKVSNLNNNHYKILDQLFKTLFEKKSAKIIGIKDENKKLISAAIFITFKNRIIYLISASANTGKANSSMFKIINQIIIENANQNKVLDFEGSMIPGVARFFKGFGAKEEFYYKVSGKSFHLLP